MGSLPGTSEIVEAPKEVNSGQCSREVYRSHLGLSVGDKERKLSLLKLGYKDSLEDDINKFFEAINIRTSSKCFGQLGTSPLNKNASKKPITMGMPRSPRIGNSEPVTLKQALRELSLTKASEVAAMKRLSKLTGSTGASEAGRIKTLYNAVVVEANKPGSSLDEGKGNVVEISLVPEQSISNDSERLPEQHQIHKMKSLSQSYCSSPQFPVATTQNAAVTEPIQDEGVSTSREVEIQTIKSEAVQNEKHTSEPSPPCSDSGGKISESVKNVLASTKKASAPKVGRKVRLHTAPSSASVSGNRGSKLSRNTARMVKPVGRNKSSVKKKIKQDTGSATCTSSTYNGVDTELDPCTYRLICERCHCTLKNASKTSNQNSSTPQSSSLSAEVSSTHVQSSAKKSGFVPDNCNKSGAALVKTKKNTKPREKGEFSQSSKSSQGDYSTSTSMSDESNVSGSSCGNRPHMSKDVRWEAIRHVRMQDGVLSLKHFNLLKKLGCGDIGTVYLAELIGTNCLFAIKVMDNEFLARRKKMPRAQTEREILRMLDHPFLPTLYAQFTSDNLACLVMEYCPGGDLHVLRQRQPGRNYSEPAARFYVAEVLLALEYLHMLGVIYRDLKPENILVREDGHIMLTDFDLSFRCTVSPTLLQSSSPEMVPARMSGPCAQSNCAEPFCIEPYCQVPCFSPRFLPAASKTRKLKNDLAPQFRSLPQLVAEPTDARSNSFVGTHEYLAPEIIKGEGHGAAVDWWTFGIFLYELLYGRTPFKGVNNEETLANVVVQTLKFPDTPLVSFQARDLISGLLVKEPEHRLGSEKGAAEIKQHPFFEGLNWALIRCAMPPEVPEFCDFEVSSLVPQENKSKYLECKTTAEHLEFELF